MWHFITFLFWIFSHLFVWCHCIYLFLFLFSVESPLFIYHWENIKKQSFIHSRLSQFSPSCFNKSRLKYFHRIRVPCRTVWQPHRGFQFTLLYLSVFSIFLLFQSKRRSQGLSLDTIYHCLNRTVLYQLCRPHKTVAQQVALLDALRVLTVNRNLVLGPGNHDQDFVACLAHCFICLHSGRWADKDCPTGGTVLRC